MMVSKVALIFFLLFPVFTFASENEQSASNKIKSSTQCEVFPNVELNHSEVSTEQNGLPLEICIQDVFDTSKPKESGVLYRLANFLHINTKTKYIKEKLLFEPGDNPSQHEVNESERILRKESYLREATITKTDEKVLVETADAWTTQPTFSMSHKAGVTTSAIGLKEDNFLGQGFRLSIKQEKDIERDSNAFKFEDKTFFSSDKSASFEYEDTSDGVKRLINLEKPFLSLDDRLTYGVNYGVLELRQTYYHHSDALYDYAADYRRREVFLGFSSGLYHRRVFRHKFGIGDRQNEFDDVSVFQTNIDNYGFSNSIVISDTLEEERFVFYELSSISDNFIEIVNFEKIASIEDLNLGFELTSKFFLVEDIIENSRYQETNLSVTKHFLINDRNLVGFYGNGIFSGNSRNRYAYSKAFYHFSQTDNFKFFSNLSYEYIDEGNKSRQLSLDEITGLRGYPLNFRDGTRIGIFTLEQRYYSDYSLWQIINLGTVLFFDRAYVENENIEGDEAYYSSVGIGFRFSSNRVSDAGIIHVDISKPLDLEDEVDSYQVGVELKRRF